MVYIHALILFALYRMYVNTHIMIIFVTLLVHVSFPFNNNRWMINVVNSTICILMKQHYKGLILVIVLFRCEFIPKSSTKINLLQAIFNWSSWGTADHYRITIIHIDSMNAILDYQGHIIQGLRSFFNYYKTFW